MARSLVGMRDLRLKKTYILAMPPCEGLLALEVQKSIYGFIIGCIKQILVDLPLFPEHLQPALTPATPMDNSQVEMDIASIVANTAGTAYRLPVRFDIDHPVRLAESQPDAVRDHSRAPKEDLAYFRD
jgi:hypothetical protein